MFILYLYGVLLFKRMYPLIGAFKKHTHSTPPPPQADETHISMGGTWRTVFQSFLGDSNLQMELSTSAGERKRTNVYWAHSSSVDKQVIVLILTKTLWVICYSLYKWGNGDSERFSDLPKSTQVGRQSWDRNPGISNSKGHYGGGEGKSRFTVESPWNSLLLYDYL